jgi:hypothetical protein
MVVVQVTSTDTEEAVVVDTQTHLLVDMAADHTVEEVEAIACLIWERTFRNSIGVGHNSSTSPIADC